jgi:hypothetical protein
MATIDYLVVGSGCSGAMAAQTLVEAGQTVVMLDAGFANPDYDSTVPSKSFLDIRHSEPEQYRYFVGKALEGAGWDDVGKGAQLTPPRQHMTQGVNDFMPVSSKTFWPIESLGYGGLGIGWGLQCWEYSKPELARVGLNAGLMTKAYETVSRRIGISGTADAAAAYTLGALQNFQASPSMDRNHALLYRKYLKRQARLKARGFYLGRTPLALLTENLGDRHKYAYRDMDYYDDNEQSAWRPWQTVNALKQKPNFEYIGGYLVLRFEEHKDHTEVHCLDLKTKQARSFSCRTLVLATGALSSGRIALRSLDSSGRLPLLCNPYTYVPCLQPSMVGRAAELKKLGFGQLSLFWDPAGTDDGLSVASLYSYQSLMLFRIIRQIPFNFADGRALMQYLSSGLVIMAVHHPDTQSQRKFIQLAAAKTATGDRLTASYHLSATERTEFTSRERRLMKVMRSLGAYPLRRLELGAGASIHYAGTLPFQAKNQPFSLSPKGRLHGTRRVFVADSAGFKFLPARGLTFSLMANAHIIASNALHHD